MADFIKCPSCGAPDQEVGKFCEQCGSKVELLSAAPATPSPLVSADPPDASPVADPAFPDASLPNTVAQGAPAADPSLAPPADGAPPVAATPDPDAPDAAASPVGPPTSPTAVLRFIRLENGVLNREHAFDVPVGSRLLVGRTDPANGVFPEVDVTMWSARVSTPEGSLYTIHRKQCYISRDAEGKVWIVDQPEYVGDTMVSPVGTSQFRPIPSLAGERDTNDEGGIALRVGDRVLMGQGEGMIIFSLMQL